MPHPAIGLTAPSTLARTMQVLLGIYVCVLPISGTTALRSMTFVGMVALTLWVWIARRQSLNLPRSLAVAWVSYGFVAVFSLVYAQDLQYSLGEMKVEVGYTLALLLFAGLWIRSLRDLFFVVVLLAVGQTIFVAGSFITLNREGFQFFGTGAWRTGVGSTSTVIVTSLPWLICLALTRIDRMFWRMAIALLVLTGFAALFLTMNRQAWIAVAATGLTAAFLVGRAAWTRRRLVLTVIAALLLIGTAATQFHLRTRSIVPATTESVMVAVDTEATAAVMKGDVRWDLWRFSLQRIAERPLSGGGFGRAAFDKLYRDYHLSSGAPLWHAHNMLINKGIQMGVPGMLAFLALWAAMAHAAWRIRCDRPDLRPWAITCLAMLAGVFVRNMTDDFFIRDHALMFWLLCGALLGAAREPATREVT